MRYTDALVVLDTMWGGSQRDAPRFFKINPQNTSGRRLYQLLGHNEFLVTNACRYRGSHANAHGTPDPHWLAVNLSKVDCELLLICGRVAAKCYAETGLEHPYEVYLKHPAARDWTKEEVKRVAQQLQNNLDSIRQQRVLDRIAE